MRRSPPGSGRFASDVYPHLASSPPLIAEIVQGDTLIASSSQLVVGMLPDAAPPVKASGNQIDANADQPGAGRATRCLTARPTRQDHPSSEVKEFCINVLL